MPTLNDAIWGEVLEKLGMRAVQQLFYDAGRQREPRLFFKLRPYVLQRNRIIDSTTIWNDLARHRGICLRNPRVHESLNFEADLHISRLPTLLNYEITKDLIFDGLSADQLRNAFNYLRNNIRFEDANELQLSFRHCDIGATDLIAFCNHVDPEQRFLHVEFWIGTTVEFVHFVQHSAVTHIKSSMNLYLPHILTNLLNVNRATPLELLEIDYIRGTLHLQPYLNFLINNIAERGRFAMEVNGMKQKADFYNSVVLHLPVQHQRYISLHRTRRTYEWSYSLINSN